MQAVDVTVTQPFTAVAALMAVAKLAVDDNMRGRAAEQAAESSLPSPGGVLRPVLSWWKEPAGMPSGAATHVWLGADIAEHGVTAYVREGRLLWPGGSAASCSSSR